MTEKERSKVSNVILERKHRERLERLQVRDRPQKTIANVREAVADYIASEGCGCCSNAEKHEKHRARLARLLDVPQYDDGSGYDFGRFRSREKRRAK